MAIPDVIAGAPRLRPGLEYYWEAFSDLSTERAIGFGAPGPIPWTSIMTYCGHHGLGRDETERMKIVMQEMDKVFMAHTAKEMKKDS